MTRKSATYPFCAVVGQTQAKKALLLHAVNPLLRGVLLSGPPGTAKTTLIQGIAELLPKRKAIHIPVHVDEERLIGEWDITNSIHHGERMFGKGLLAQADGHLVTIDNAGRMPKRVLKMILTAAESGYVEAESRTGYVLRPTRFRLYGTIDPEAGEPLTAMLDRWGLSVRLETSTDPAERTKIVRRLFAFARDPDNFRRRFAHETEKVRQRMAAANKRLAAIQIDEYRLQLAAEIAEEAHCAGHRAEILLVETARTIAAWEGASALTEDHLREAAAFVLPHRMHTSADPKGVKEDTQKDGMKSEQKHKSETNQHSRESSYPGSDHGVTPSAKPVDDGSEPDLNTSSGSEAKTIIEAIGQEIDIQPFMFTPPQALKQAHRGRRNQAGWSSASGRYVRATIPRGPLRDLAYDATFRTAAPFQRLRRERYATHEKQLAVLIEPSDLRVKVRENRTGTALWFVVDASGSMNAGKRMKAVKGAVLSMLRDAYRQRDSVGLIAFRDQKAELLLEMTRSVELAERQLRMMPTGGKTPLSAGLSKGLETIGSTLYKGSVLIPALIVLTDGKANVSIEPEADPWRESRFVAQRIAAADVRTLVIDTEEGLVRLGYARKLAHDLQAQYVRLEELEASRIEQAVRSLI